MKEWRDEIISILSEVINTQNLRTVMKKCWVAQDLLPQTTYKSAMEIFYISEPYKILDGSKLITAGTRGVALSACGRRTIKYIP